MNKAIFLGRVLKKSILGLLEARSRKTRFSAFSEFHRLKNSMKFAAPSMARVQAVSLRLVPALIFSALFLCGAAHAELESVKTEYGSLQIGALFQAGFDYYIGDEQLTTGEADLDGDGVIADDGSESGVLFASDRASDMEFLLHRARLIFKGTIVDDHVGYFLQTELARESGPELLDMRLAFSYIPYTTFSIGRFLPWFTYWMPMKKSHIFLIELPQLNEFLGVQRQTGFNIGVFHKYFELNLGVFNGRNEPNISLNPADRGGAPLGANTRRRWRDENTDKDVGLSGAIKPIDGLRVFGGYWYGRPLDYFEIDNGEKTAHNAQVGIIDWGAAYLTHWGLRLWAEFMTQRVRFDSRSSISSEGDRPDDSYEYSAVSYYLMGGYNFKNQGVPFEIIGRWDFLDPDTKNDDDRHPGSEKDGITHITAGFNYYIQGNAAMLSLNYIYKSEDVELLNKKLDDEQTGISNDELKLQVQLAF